VGAVGRDHVGRTQTTVCEECEGVAGRRVWVVVHTGTETRRQAKLEKDAPIAGMLCPEGPWYLKMEKSRCYIWLRIRGRN